MSEEELEFCRTLQSLSVLREFFGTVESELEKVRQQHQRELNELITDPKTDWVNRLNARLNHHFRFEVDWQQLQIYSFVVFLNMIAEVKLAAFCGLVAAKQSRLESLM